ncbi:MAG: response regulator [Proteobacteria bacterium]|nr:response regulator [Pseudomonadota bacterium]
MMNNENVPARIKVLIVDDDKKLCRLVGDYLQPMGYDVEAVHTGPSGLEKAMAGDFHVVILDVMMPGMDGFEVLKKLRKASDIPVLMLTALGDETDRVVGLEMGADDYLPKTFSTRELLARLRAVTRRYFKTERAEKSPQSDLTLIIGDLQIFETSRTARLGVETLSLTPLEFDLLVSLIKAAGRVLTRDQLLDAIAGRSYEIFDRSIDVHISSLRRKLGDTARSPKFIRTVRSAGYMFQAPAVIHYEAFFLPVYQNSPLVFHEYSPGCCGPAGVFRLLVPGGSAAVFGHQTTVLFSRALLANPRAIGAACPISSRLARRHHCRPGMLPFNDGLLLEIGGGPRMVTTALLRRGVDPGKLAVVEQDRLPAQHMKDRFPNVAVVHGKAVKLCQLYNSYGRHVGTMVPSPPLLSLPSCRVGSPWPRVAENAGRQWLIHSVHLSTQ